MEKVGNFINASKVIRMTKSSESKLQIVASNLKNKELFSEKINIARKSLQGIQSLPY